MIENYKSSVFKIMIKFAYDGDGILFDQSLDIVFNDVQKLLGADIELNKEVMELLEYINRIGDRCRIVRSVGNSFPENVDYDVFFLKTYILGFLDKDYKSYSDCIIKELIEIEGYGFNPHSI